MLATECGHCNVIQYLNKLNIFEHTTIEYSLDSDSFDTDITTKKRLKLIFEHNYVLDKYLLSQYVVKTLDIHLIDILFDKEFIDKYLFKYVVHNYSKITIIKKSCYNKLCLMLEHCLKKNIIIDTSYIICLNNIDLLDLV